MNTYQEIFEFVESTNGILTKVVPLYKVSIEYYNKKEIFFTENVSVVNKIAAPYIDIDIENKEECEKYQIDLYTYNERAEYIWYLLFKEEWKELSEEIFDQCYKKCWDSYHKEGGWDLVSEKMASIVQSYYNDLQVESTCS